MNVKFWKLFRVNGEQQSIIYENSPATLAIEEGTGLQANLASSDNRKLLENTQKETPMLVLELKLVIFTTHLLLNYINSFFKNSHSSDWN